MTGGCCSRSSWTGPGTARSPRPRPSPAQVLLNRLHTGRWDVGALAPASLNAQANGLGPDYNIFASGKAAVPTPAAFVRYRPPAYLRPFDLLGR